MTEARGVTTAIHVAAPPPVVVAWLLHAPAFPRWVVGPGRMVDVDGTWPAPGAGFTHETGHGPLRYRDRTVLRHLDADGGHLGIEAKIRPLGTAAIQLHVQPDGDGSRVVMHERPLDGPATWVPDAYRPLLRVRNTVAMRRLRRLVERTGAAPPGRGPETPHTAA